jgi:hypothetical protein
MNQTWHFINPQLTESDKDLFFGPLEGNEIFIPIESNWTMAHILVKAGVFPSLTQAKKQGIIQNIPAGWSHLIRGKGINRKDIFILNWFES